MSETRKFEQRMAKGLRSLADGLDAGRLTIGEGGVFIRGIFSPIEEGESQKLVGRRWVLPLMFANEQTEGTDTHV